MPFLMSIFPKTAGVVFPSTLPQLPEPAAPKVEGGEPRDRAGRNCTGICLICSGISFLKELKMAQIKTKQNKTHNKTKNLVSLLAQWCISLQHHCVNMSMQWGGSGAVSSSVLDSHPLFPARQLSLLLDLGITGSPVTWLGAQLGVISNSFPQGASAPFLEKSLFWGLFWNARRELGTWEQQRNPVTPA